MNKYKIGGLILGTEIDFPELIETKDGNVDFTIKYGNFPDILGGNSILEISPNGVEWYINDNNQVLCVRSIERIPYHFKCLIDNNEVIFHNDIKGSNIIQYYRRFLLLSLSSIVSFNNNLYPIHGCGVSYKGESFIISGNSGEGKSTLNMLLQERGFKTIGDDVLNVYVDNKKSYVHPGPPVSFLIDDSIDILNMWDIEKIILRDPIWRTTYSTIGNFDNITRPIRKIYNLSKYNEDIYISSNINISEKTRIIKNNAYCGYLFGKIDSEKQKRMITDIANYTEIVNFKRPKDLNKINETVDFIINDIKNNV